MELRHLENSNQTPQKGVHRANCSSRNVSQPNFYFLHHGETRIEKQLIPKRSGQLRTIRIPTTTTESTVFLVKHSSTSRRVSVETLKRENKPVVTEKKVWRWRRSNLTRTISKSRTSKIPMQGMKCTTLKSNGLPEVESLEMTPGWKSTMLALFGKFGLSELWYKDQNKTFHWNPPQLALNFPIECFMEGIKPVA